MALRPMPALHQHRGHVLITGPQAEPVSAAELRSHLGMGQFDTEILPSHEADDFITDARGIIEEATGLALLNQSWRLSLDMWPEGRAAWWDGVRQGSITELHGGSGRSLTLPRYPLSSVTSCKVFDEAGNQVVVTIAATFDVDTYSKPGRLALKRGATWPIALRAVNAIEIDYIAGHGDTVASVPGPLKRAVRHLAAYLFEHRGDACAADDMLAKSGAGAILGAYRVQRI
jgi:hypothetical protein